MKNILSSLAGSVALLVFSITAPVLAQTSSSTSSGPHPITLFRLGIPTPAGHSGEGLSTNGTTFNWKKFQPYSSELVTMGTNGASFYLSRTNHTGTQPYTTITGLGTLATQDANIADYLTKVLADATYLKTVTAATTYQPLSSTLTTLSSATAAGLALMDDLDAAAQRSTLGLGTAATASLGLGTNNVIYNDGSYTNSNTPFRVTDGSSHGELDVDGAIFDNLDGSGFWMLLHMGLPTANRTHTFPDRSGTILHEDGDGSALTGLTPYQLAQVSAADGNVMLWSTANNRWQASTSKMLSNGFILSTSAAPTTDPPTGSFTIYVDPADQKLKARGSSGTITTIANP